MRLDLAYLGHSQVHRAADGLALDFAPNLTRPAVFFDGTLAEPLRFREAISALHDVVVGDFRFKKRDKTAYREYLQQQRLEEQAHRSQAEKAAKAGAMGMMPGGPPPDLEAQFRKQHQKYWSARISLANRLAREDPALFRALVPCDPVVTVAPDVVLFEGFAKDESSYGCLSLDRNGLVGGQQQSLGTTNVDYSMALYEQFQTLRSYRPTRLKVDPKGFEVAVQGAEDYREEKIDLPPSWLRAFGQVQAAMTLPARTVPLDIATIYGALSFLKRHKEKSGPRSLRLELTPQKPPELVLEPWNHRLVSEGTRYQGPRPETIKLWGRRRLMVLARLLPLAERIEVRVLGSGLPHVWLVHMGALRFTLGLSGWTSNDWSSGAAAPRTAPSRWCKRWSSNYQRTARSPLRRWRSRCYWIRSRWTPPCSSWPGGARSSTTLAPRSPVIGRSCPPR